MAWWQRFLRGPQGLKYDSLDLFREIYGGRPASTGMVVTWSRALEVATVLACCRVIAEGVAQVPWKLFQDDGTDIQKKADDHPLCRLLYHMPNPWQTSFEFRETIAMHAVLVGNAYILKAMVGSAREIRQLIPLEPQNVTVRKISDKAFQYTYQPLQAEPVTFSGDMIWHIRGPSWNSWQGMDAVKLAREAIGLSIAAESAHAEFHKNNSRVTGIYAIDGTLSKEQHEFLLNYLDKYAMGGERAGKPVILDRGGKFTPQQMTGVDAQHIETRNHQIEEICRAFRVMPIMVGFSDKASTYASSEQMFIAHVVHTLMPWFARIEQSADVNLLSEDDQKAGFYTKFVPNALMRGAAKDRAEFYSRALGAGGSPAWMTPNDVRGLEEMERSDDANADRLFWPPDKQQPAQQQGAA